MIDCLTNFALDVILIFGVLIELSQGPGFGTFLLNIANNGIQSDFGLVLKGSGSKKQKGFKGCYENKM